MSCSLVLVVFKNAGDAPPLKQKKFKVSKISSYGIIIDPCFCVESVSVAVVLRQKARWTKHYVLCRWWIPVYARLTLENYAVQIKGEEKFAAVIAFLRGQLNRETLVSLHAYLFHFLDRRRDSLVLCRNFIVASFQLLILYQCLTVLIFIGSVVYCLKISM